MTYNPARPLSYRVVTTWPGFTATRLGRARDGRQVKRAKGQSECRCDCLVGDTAAVDIHPVGHSGQRGRHRAPAAVGKLEHIGKRYITKRVGTRSPDRAGHVGYAIVNDPLLDIRWVL